MKSPIKYQRLPGHGWTWTGPARLWLGEDHVLLVLNHCFHERYRRFFFADIQAVTVCRTHAGKVWTAVWAMMFLFFGGIALMVPAGVATVVLASMAAPFGLLLLGNIALGPTCSCYVWTAVQTERVSAITRVRTARKFLERVQPKITEAQGQPTPVEVAAESEPRALQE